MASIIKTYGHVVSRFRGELVHTKSDGAGQRAGPERRRGRTTGLKRAREVPLLRRRPTAAQASGSASCVTVLRPPKSDAIRRAMRWIRFHVVPLRAVLRGL